MAGHYEDALDWLEANYQNELPLSPVSIARIINPNFVMGAEYDLVDRGIMEEPEPIEKKMIASASVSQAFGRLKRAGEKGRGAPHVPSRFTAKTRPETMRTFTAPKGKVLVVKRDEAGNIVSIGLTDE